MSEIAPLHKTEDHLVTSKGDIRFSCASPSQRRGGHFQVITENQEQSNPLPTPTSSHWAPPSASSLRATPWSRPALCSTPHPPPICWFTGLFTLTEPTWSLILSLMQYYNLYSSNYLSHHIISQNCFHLVSNMFPMPGRCPRQRRIRDWTNIPWGFDWRKKYIGFVMYQFLNLK